MRTRETVCVGALLLAATWPARALAGNDEEVLIGGEAAMSGGAVTATTSDGAAGWYNPAGLASVDRDTVDVSGSVFALRHYRIDDFIATAAGEGVDARTTELVTIPSALTLVRPLSENVRVGVGVFVPVTNDVSMRESLDSVDPVDSTWILDLHSTTQAYHANASLAFRVGDRVRLGVSLGGVYRSESARFEFFGGVQAPTGETGIFGATADLSAFTLGIEVAGGVQVDVTDRLTFGLSARSPTFDFYSSFDSAQVTTSASAGGMSEPSIELRPEDLSESGIGRGSIGPPVVRAGLALRFDRGWLALDGDLRPSWNAPSFDVRRELVWNARLGGIFRVSESVAVGGGLFTDRAADPEPVEFTDSRIHFYGVSAGVQLDNRHEMAADEEADSIVFSSNIALRYAYGSGVMNGLLIDFDTDDVLVTNRVDVSVHEVGLHIGSALYF